MLTWILRRVLAVVPVLFGVTLAVFSMLFLVPGDPVKMMLAEFVTNPDQVAQMRAQLHLDEPILQQYGRFVANAARGDLGTSIRSRRPVTTEISENVASTAQLAVAAMLVAVAVGVPLGLLAALSRNSWLDVASMGTALLGVSMPSFWLGLLLIFAFSLHLAWFPANRGGDHRPAHAVEHARGAGPGLRPHRARQGARRLRRRRASRAQERADPDHHHLRPAVRQPPGRGGDRGDGVQPARARAAHRWRHPEQGLPARTGHRPLRGHRLRADQSARRRGLCVCRPADPAGPSVMHDVSLVRRLVRHRGALVGLLILGALLLMASAAPWLSPRDPIKTAPKTALQPPGTTYWLGSDQLGRDVASRVLHGARISL